MRPRQSLALVVLASFAAHSVGCASSTCARVREDREAFMRRTGSPGPHLALAVPFQTLSASLQRGLTQAGAVQVPLPDLGPVDLGSLAVSLRGVAFAPAEPGRLGVRVSLGIASGGRQVTALDLDTVIAPQLDPREGSVRLRLRAEDLESVRPSLQPAERRRFAAVVLSLVPASARAFVGREQVEALTDTFLRDLVGGRWPLIRDRLLKGTGDLVDVEIDLPELPLTKIELQSGPADVWIYGHTSLAADSLSPGPARPAGTDARLVAVRLAGGAAAALANRAIAQGQLPARYDREGQPDPNGELTAGVGWQAGERPLKVHAWALQGQCARLTFGGTPQLQGRAGQLELRVDDGKLEEVRGSLRVRAGVWFSGLGRQTFAISQSVVGATEFEIVGVDYRATVVTGRVDGSDLVFSLALAEAPRSTPRSR
jgi:hypothetical protein